jgi:hypothetical protein
MMSALQSDVIVEEAGAVVARTIHTALDGRNTSLTLSKIFRLAASRTVQH